MIFPRRALIVSVLAAATVATPLWSQSTSRDRLSVVFLYDFSTSVATSLYHWSYSAADDPVLGDFATGLLSQLHETDTLRFGFVTHRLYLSRPYSGHELSDFYRQVVQKTDVRNIDRVGGSPLWDALDSAVSSLQPAEGRGVVLLVSDGQSSGNAKGLEEVLADATRARVAVCPFFIGDRRLLSPDWPVHPADTLARIADATGGKYTLIQEVEVYSHSDFVERSGFGLTRSGGPKFLPDPTPPRTPDIGGPPHNFPRSTILEPIAKVIETLRQ